MHIGGIHSFYSHIIELKNLPMTATEADAEKQWNEAVEQIHTLKHLLCTISRYFC